MPELDIQQDFISKCGAKTPQGQLNEFWGRFKSKNPGKVLSVLPQNLQVDIIRSVKDTCASHNAAESYEAAAKECKERIRQIVRECKRTNEKFADPDFDIENDKKDNLGNCLRGLIPPEDGTTSFPGSIHRVDWIFENPQFIVDGYSHTDIKQGGNGDCWWLAAVATICDRPDLMDRICVARDADCGVYGFVFHRDGEWVSTVVDDNLYLKEADFDFEKDRYDSTGKRAREHKKRYQTGSSALYFAQCLDPNETWLPLMEKAYAKIHGDYEAISGGWSGEAVEDLTGGVTTTIASNRVLNKALLWSELVNAQGEFVFAASAMAVGANDTKGGLALGHAYSILRATEEVDESGNRVRLVLFRNPWGERDVSGVGEWNGPWSDGSKEWNPYWLRKLGHQFGDDGIFWMTYEDMLSTFMFLHRTRIFDDKWTVIQRWTSVNVPWISGYLQTKFVIDIKKAGPVVIVLCQLDQRYFRGLEGQYTFQLHFILQEADKTSDQHIVTVRPVHPWEDRSVSAEVTLEPGKYEVIPKILATRDTTAKKVEDVVKEWVDKSPRKLKQVGINYDLAHAKGICSEQSKLPKQQERSNQDQNKTVSSQKKDEKDASPCHETFEKPTEHKEHSKKVEKLDSSRVSHATVEMLEGYRVNKQGKVLNEEGEIIGELEDGDVSSCAGKKINAKGEVMDVNSQLIGKVKLAGHVVDESSHQAQAQTDANFKEDETNDDANIHAANDSPLAQKDEKDDGNEEDQKDEKREGEEEKEEENRKSDCDSDNELDSDGPVPWNAVCVIGLRVYAQDSDATIKLKAQTDAEETVESSCEEVP